MIAARPALLALAVAVLATGCLSKPSDFECTFGTVSDMEGPVLGTSGGGPNTFVDCGARSVVGLGFTITVNESQTFRQKLAVTARLRCATLATSDGVYTTGPTNDVSVAGGFATAEGPHFESCPEGQVVIGLAAHIVDKVGNHFFSSLAIDCSAIDESGTPTGSPTRIPILATGEEPRDGQIRCRNGLALHGLKTWSGSEMDRIQLGCGRTACVKQPPP